MTTQQIIALANAGFTAQQIDAFTQAMGDNPAYMPGAQQVQQKAQPIQQESQPIQQGAYPVHNYQDVIQAEIKRQIESMRAVPNTNTDFTMKMAGTPGNVEFNPSTLASYQAVNRENAGMTNTAPTMNDITNQIINGAVQEAMR